MKEKILAINPGSTSTKVAVFEGEKMVFKETVIHDAAQLAQYDRVGEQLPYRKQTILDVLGQHGVDISDCEAFAGRGGGTKPIEGGVYEVNDAMLADVRSGKYGGNHPALLGSQLAWEFAMEYGARAFIVNPPDTDEFCDEARMTGVKGFYRESHLHALNQKETALRVCAQRGLDYQKANLVVTHMGGGVTVTAHRMGRMVDSNDAIGGDGPMAPTRAGAVSPKAAMDILKSGRSMEELSALITKNGGFVDHLGTSEAIEVREMMRKGNRYAKLVYDTFAYQIAKEIGAMAAVLRGSVDVIILTGGIAHDNELCEDLIRRIGFVAPVEVRPGEFEMEALAGGALRVLRGAEQAKHYTGLPVFSGFDDLWT